MLSGDDFPIRQSPELLPTPARAVISMTVIFSTVMT